MEQLLFRTYHIVHRVLIEQVENEPEWKKSRGLQIILDVTQKQHLLHICVEISTYYESLSSW